MPDFFSRRINKDTLASTQKIELSAWIAQIIGIMIIHIVFTAVIIALAYIAVRVAILTKSGLLTVLAVIVVGLAIIGISGIVIDITNIITLAHEKRNLKK